MWPNFEVVNLINCINTTTIRFDSLCCMYDVFIGERCSSGQTENRDEQYEQTWGVGLRCNSHQWLDDDDDARVCEHPSIYLSILYIYPFIHSFIYSSVRFMDPLMKNWFC